MSIEIIKWKPAKRTEVDEDIFVEPVNTFLKMINCDQKRFKTQSKNNCEETIQRCTIRD